MPGRDYGFLEKNLEPEMVVFLIIINSQNLKSNHKNHVIQLFNYADKEICSEGLNGLFYCLDWVCMCIYMQNYQTHDYLENELSYQGT